MDNTSTLKEELEYIDERVEELKYEIEVGAAIAELHDNPQFKLVIEDGYMEKEAQRILGVLTTPMNLKREKNEDLIAKLESIRHLREFFKTSLIASNTAKENIDEVENDRSKITAEYAKEDSIIDAEVE